MLIPIDFLLSRSIPINPRSITLLHGIVKNTHMVVISVAVLVNQGKERTEYINTAIRAYAAKK